MVVPEGVDQLVRLPSHQRAYFDNVPLLQLLLDLAAQKYDVLLAELLDVKRLHVGVAHIHGIVQVELIVLEDIIERLQVAAQAGLVPYLHIGQYLLDRLLNGIELHIYLRKRHSEEEQRRIEGHNRRAGDGARLYRLQARLLKAMRGGAHGGQIPCVVIGDHQPGGVDDVAEFVGHLPKHRGAHGPLHRAEHLRQRREGDPKRRNLVEGQLIGAAHVYRAVGRNEAKLPVGHLAAYLL